MQSEALQVKNDISNSLNQLQYLFWLLIFDTTSVK